MTRYFQLIALPVNHNTFQVATVVPFKNFVISFIRFLRPSRSTLFNMTSCLIPAVDRFLLQDRHNHNHDRSA